MMKHSVTNPLYECSDDLAEMLERMRAEQKAFFNSKFGTTEKVAALINSKRLEKELDAFLQRRTAEKVDIQTKLF